MLAYKDDQRVSKLDADIASFIRALGSVAASLSSTVTVAMGQLEKRSMGNLEPYIRRLQSRLDNQLDQRASWERFTDETGSELVRRSTQMFVDGTKMGGDPEVVAKIASDYALSISLLRAKRQATASTFAFLTIPLHGAMVALLLFVLEVVKGFDGRLGAVADGASTPAASIESGLSSAALSTFQSGDLGVVSGLFLLVIASLTLVNSVAPKLAMGGHIVKTVSFAGPMLVISGGLYLTIPVLAQRLF